MPWHLSGGSWPPPHCVLTQTLLETEYPVPLPLGIRRTGLKSQVHPWTSLSSAASRKALLPVTVGFRALTYDFGGGGGRTHFHSQHQRARENSLLRNKPCHPRAWPLLCRAQGNARLLITYRLWTDWGCRLPGSRTEALTAGTDALQPPQLAGWGRLLLHWVWGHAPARPAPSSRRSPTSSPRGPGNPSAAADAASRPAARFPGLLLGLQPEKTLRSTWPPN